MFRLLQHASQLDCHRGLALLLVVTSQTEIRHGVAFARYSFYVAQLGQTCGCLVVLQSMLSLGCTPHLIDAALVQVLYLLQLLVLCL